MVSKHLHLFCRQVERAVEPLFDVRLVGPGPWKLLLFSDVCRLYGWRDSGRFKPSSSRVLVLLFLPVMHQIISVRRRVRVFLAVYVNLG